ncbi:DUF2214 family protein [Bradyrhizobium sp. KBS0727]|nr:DUF2214 family protein [Bradyrhizobium sp. KBS0725]QDW45899.1 DUF2214 family protein [Bradyrhizobium sp. KBS0727]
MRFSTLHSTVGITDSSPTKMNGQVPEVSAKQLRLVTAVIHGELFAMVIILLCAAIVARGGWV